MRMTSALLAISISASVILVGCTEDPNAAANALMVEASVALKKSEGLDAMSKEALGERKELLTLALGNLEKIVSDYPSSGSAVDLATQGEAKGIVLSEVKEDLESVEKVLFCLENINDGNCVLDRLLDEERMHGSDPDRRTAVAVVLASSGRFQDALSLVPSIDAPPSRDIVLGGTAIFGILLDDPKVEKLVFQLLEEQQRDLFKDFLANFRTKLDARGWKRSNDLAASFTVDPATAPQQLQEAFAGLAENFQAGEMEKVRLQLTQAFLVAQAASQAASDDDPFKEFRKEFEKAVAVLIK